MPTAFLTGCGSGFGHALARRLLDLGWRVVATDPTLHGWPAALGAPRPDLQLHAVDVRDGAQIRAAAEAAGEVDLVVNNAGYALFCTQEEGDIDAVRDLFEVNVFGAMRVAKALLPALRRSQGTLVQLSSVAGRTAFPESGFYAATKYAIEAVSEALIQEVGPLGVRLRVVEPGSFATRFLDRAAQVSPPPPPDSPYAALRPGWTARKREVLEVPQSPQLVVDAIIASLDDPAPFRRLMVGPDAQRILDLRGALGADPWARLSADRNGLADAPHDPDDVPGPAELLALPTDHPGFVRARLAHRQGHLGHWLESEIGRRALARLTG